MPLSVNIVSFREASVMFIKSSHNLCTGIYRALFNFTSNERMVYLVNPGEKYSAGEGGATSANRHFLNYALMNFDDVSTEQYKVVTIFGKIQKNIFDWSKVQNYIVVWFFTF